MERDVCFTEPFRESLKNLKRKFLLFDTLSFLKRNWKYESVFSFLGIIEKWFDFPTIMQAKFKKKEYLRIISAFSIAVVAALQPKIHLNCFFCFYREVCGTDLYVIKKFLESIGKMNIVRKT